jgi:hypothetical protein
MAIPAYQSSQLVTGANVVGGASLLAPSRTNGHPENNKPHCRNAHRYSSVRFKCQVQAPRSMNTKGT